MAEANLITQFWTQPTNYFPFVLSTVMALSGKSSVLLLRGELWQRLKTIVLWQAAISTLSSGSQQGQGHGSRFKCPPATSALWNTRPVLTLLGDWLFCAPQDAELHPGKHLTLPKPTWIFAGFPQDGREKSVSVPVSQLAAPSDTPDHHPCWLKSGIRTPWRLLLTGSRHQLTVQGSCTSG